MNILTRIGTELRAQSGLLVALVILLVLSGLLQRHVEARRIEAHLALNAPEKQDALEAGLLAFGGFRGVLADLLWVRAIAQQDAGRYYELKLICDMIQKLQPTFAQVHAYQAYNMAYNLAFHSESCEDKWYWIRSAIETLEHGIARNEHNYSLWYELGYIYYDRLSNEKLYDKNAGPDCRVLRLRELPRLDDLNEAQRAIVFSRPENWQRGRAREDESIRFAAYYFYRSLQTGTETNPLPTERVFGNCLDRLGLLRSRKIPQVSWDDWGSEEWWLELIRRNQARGLKNELSIPQNLQFSLMAQMDFAQKRLETRELNAAYLRFKEYFPADPRSLETLLKEYRAILFRTPRLAPAGTK